MANLSGSISTSGPVLLSNSARRSVVACGVRSPTRSVGYSGIEIDDTDVRQSSEPSGAVVVVDSEAVVAVTVVAIESAPEPEHAPMIERISTHRPAFTRGPFSSVERYAAPRFGAESCSPGVGDFPEFWRVAPGEFQIRPDAPAIRVCNARFRDMRVWTAKFRLRPETSVLRLQRRPADPSTCSRSCRGCADFEPGFGLNRRGR